MKKKQNVKEQGFTLVELLVAVSIGLFGVVIMSQFFLSFNKDKSRALNGANALNNSKLAMAVIESDLRNAGYGITANGGLDCEEAYGNYNGEEIEELTIDGVLINDSTGFNNSDEIIIQYGDGSSGVGGGLLRTAFPAGATEMYPTQVFGCLDRDVILLASGNQCALRQVSNVDKVSFKITLNTNQEYNPSASDQAGWPTFPIDSYATCIGGYNRIKYRVRNGILEKETFPGGFEAVIDNVVAMKAQYGISDNPNSNSVTQWVNATGDWANINAERRKQIKSIRVGFVMRNTEIEKEDVSQPCDPELNVGLCIWQSDDPNSPPPELNITTPENWQKYRYVTLSTITPLKNMLWN